MGNNRKVAIMAAPIFIVVVLVAASMQSAEATTYKVGDGQWSVPSDSSFYSTWASSITFYANDILEFNFGGNHDVAQVSEEAYQNCDVTSTPISFSTASPTSITLSATSYFICTAGVQGSHCNGGQKLAVTVSTTNSSTPTPPTTSTPSPPPPTSDTASTPPPPPPSNSTSSPTAAASYVILGLLYLVGLLI